MNKKPVATDAIKADLYRRSLAGHIPGTSFTIDGREYRVSRSGAWLRLDNKVRQHKRLRISQSENHPIKHGA